MNSLLNLSERYMAAFGAKDLEAVAAFLDEQFVLTDPAGTFTGKATVLDYIAGIFGSVESLDFRARNIFVDENAGVSVIEFTLQIGDKALVGTDVVEWEGEKMRALRAYLY